MEDGFPDLHVHLYGSLLLDDLRYLHSRNKPRWEIFRKSYAESYGRDPVTENLFSPSNKALLSDYYFYLSPGNFSEFQTAFDLVISLSSTEPEELQEILQRVAERQSSHAEYRMLFSVKSSLSEFQEKISALCEEAERINKSRSKLNCITIASSLHREDDLCFDEYAVLKQLQKNNKSVMNTLSAVDFCAKEEGFPPGDKKKFIEQVQYDNRIDPSNALAVLYHVGESYSDKTLESAVRWVCEAAEFGAHRLGHAAVLGVKTESFSGKTGIESRKERTDHLKFLLKNEISLKESGYEMNRKQILEELNTENTGNYSINYDAKNLRNLEIFQNWSMDRIREYGAVIECCPSSNLRIAGVESMKVHPVKRFLQRGLAVVVGSDDPGILSTRIEDEFGIVFEQDYTDSDMRKKITEDSETYRSLNAVRKTNGS